MSFNWQTEKVYEEIKYESYEGIAKITINRPEVHNAFTPKTVTEMIDAFNLARDNSNLGVIILTGEGEKLSVLAETKKFVVTVVTLAMTKSHA